MHIKPFENNNNPLIEANNKYVPLNYFNIVKLKKDQIFQYQIVL